MKRGQFLLAASIVFGVLPFSAGALGTPVTSRAMKHLVRQLPSNPKRKMDKGICTDFSGHWVGTCNGSDGDVITDWVKIRQYDCSSLAMETEGNSDDIEVGRVDRIGWSDFDFLSSADLSGIWDWDAFRKILTSDVAGSYHTLSVPATGTIQAKQSLVIIDGQLKIRFEQSILGSGNEAYWEECLFSKQ